MAALTQRFNEISGETRTLENQAQRMSDDAARVTRAIRDLHNAVERLTLNSPAIILRRAADEIRQGGRPDLSLRLAAE